MKINKTIEDNYIGILMLIFIILLILTMGSSSAATTGNTSKVIASHNSSNSGLNNQDCPPSSTFSIENQFRSAGNDGYPNPGQIVNSANYTKWVWTNIILTNNGPDDSNITIQDKGTGVVFYNPKIGWNGWVRINDGTGWKKDTTFNVKTGTGTYFITNGSCYQIAILGYINNTGTIRNDVTEINQDKNGPDIYPSTYQTLKVPDAAIIRLNGEFRVSLNGSPVNSSKYKNWIYSTTRATNQGPNSTKAVFKIDTYGLTSNGTYAVSRDNGKTWKYSDDSFDLTTGLWTTSIPSNGSWLLAVYSRITKWDSPKSTVYLLSQDVYNPYGADNVRPKCLIVFDDGNKVQYAIAFKYMQSLGITGTVYVNGYNIGTDGVLTIDDLKEMAAAGWIIGNHGYSHKILIQISDDDIKSEISNGINFLTSIGLPEGALNLAFPGGYYNDDVLEIMKSLGVLTGRSTNGELIYSLNGLDLYRLPAYTILNTTSVSSIKGYVDNAIQSGSNIVLLFHNIAPRSSDSYVYPEADFKAIMDYIYSTGIDCININQLYSQSTDVPINIPPYDLDSNTILPFVESMGLLNNTSLINVPTPMADIAIKINASNNSPSYGDNIILTITVTNNGPDIAENVTVGEWLDGDFFKYISDNGNGTYDPNTIIWTVGDLENGESKVLKLVVQIVKSNSIIKNIATYNSGSTDDSNWYNNYQYIDLYVAPRTCITINSANAYVGDKVKLVITLVDENNNPIADKVVNLTINGENYDATTNNDGITTIIYTTDKAGTFNLIANFNKNPDFSSSSSSNTLTVMKRPTTITSTNLEGYNGDLAVLTARLYDTNSEEYLANKTVKFLINGTSIGTAKTNINGTAILQYNIKQKPGSYNLTSIFNQDNMYSTSYLITTLTVVKTPTSIKINSTKGYLQDTVHLIATVWNSHKNMTVTNKTVKFYVYNHYVGSALTNKSGIAILNYHINLKTSGNYPIKAVTLEDTNYEGSTANANLVVKRIITLISSKVTIKQIRSNANANSYKGFNVIVQAQLKDSHKNKFLSGKEVNFFVDGKLIGKSKTNKSGIATFNYISKPTSNKKTFKVYFTSDSTFIGSSNTKSLKITN
ncbi:MAG: polysaccharide deacetylase family protein [Methanobacterium sp. ERen5]|nr:MAG: polysaccharide deacetylase family protein [Methanobacterium sp. ERen5]